MLSRNTKHASPIVRNKKKPQVTAGTTIQHRQGTFSPLFHIIRQKPDPQLKLLGILIVGADCRDSTYKREVER